MEYLTYVDAREIGKEAYLDLRTNEIVVVDGTETISGEEYVLVPSRKELCTFSEAFDLFCEENKVFPNADGPSQWLRENGEYEDFRAFYDTMVAKKIEIWLEKVTEKMKCKDMYQYKDNNTAAYGVAPLFEGYDYAVATRMNGRAGASSPYGGKGIAMEVMYKDQKNLQNLVYSPFSYTDFTKNSTAPCVDLVTVKYGQPVARFQCKDTVSTAGITKTLKQVQTGKYNSSQMVGTTETAELFNSKAEAMGISKKMIDSGISTKDTSRIANKFNGVPSTVGIGNAVSKCAKAGAIVNGTFAAIESVANGDDVYDATKKISSSALDGTISTGAGALIYEGAMMTMALAPVPLIAKFIVAGTASLVGSTFVSKNSSEFCDDVGDLAGSIAEDAVGVVEDLGSLGECLCEMAADSITEVVENVGDAVGSFFEDVFSWF